MSADGLHARGLFGTVGGRDIELLSWGNAGTFGAPVDYASAREEVAPEYAGKPEATRLPSPGVVSIPLSDVSDFGRWEWMVVFEGASYRVLQERAGWFLIGTTDPRVAAMSDEWEGSLREGWARWIDATGCDITDEWRPYRVGGA